MSRGTKTAIPIFLVFALVRGGWLWFSTKQGKRIDGRREAALWVLLLYLSVLYSITVFSRSFHMESTLAERISRINWVPFRETWKLYRNGAVKLFIVNAAGNIAWFIPLGLLWPLARPGKYALLRTAAAIILTSLVIEILQLLTGAGISDIDDLITNALGGFLGMMPNFAQKTRRTCRKYTQKSG